VKQRAQEMVEYGLIMATIAVLLLLGGVTFGDRLRAWLEAVAERVTTST